ncbi:unnamed protein product (macronuclear) [Paramecium tetraurelia]|uniref:LITAF domain-containing protein n=1 Tax=Paramecium tetraurelia TaxID=5888 RepID=A0BT63_PARTE|nr:uncharacterized protein GSPATT00031962001 [Paramecium tetraurelia]CAK61730.1 unnamed protein product [Paramecium tetraurelia]|eukprot:XP_001429128.1 hypothetical protein (macronuclear) [Paramecium tetraurelia strain d4-2]
MISNPMMESDQNNQQTRSGQSQGTYQLVKSSQIELSVRNKLIEQETEYPKVPQSRQKEKLLCTSCNQVVESNVQYEMGRCSYIVMIILIAGIITAILAFLPCLLDNCKDAKHKCSKCAQLIGTKKFICG